MTAILRAAAWIGALDALAGVLLYAFLRTPESNVLMLGVSATLVLLAAALLLLSSSSAADALVVDRAPWASLGAAVRRMPLVVFVILIVGALCGAAGWFEQWWMARGGEFDAAAIAAGDITRTGWVHTTVHWIVVLIQWVIVPAWLATALAWLAGYERRDVLTLKWLTAGLDWRLLVVTLLAVVVLVWLPWRAVYWRPRGLPASTLELAFTVVKLGVIYALSQLAWALVLRTAARQVTAAPVATPAPLTTGEPTT